MHKRPTHNITTWCARVALSLLLLGVAASANAATIYNFTFTDGSTVVASGSFTTDGVGVDPGYELMASMTFDYAHGFNSGLLVGPFTATLFHDGAAYKPATGAFINHFSGNSYPNLGNLYPTRPGLTLELSPGSFALNRGLYGYVRDGNGIFDTLRPGELAITPVATAVPEPTSLVLLGTGLIGAALRRRAGTRRVD